MTRAGATEPRSGATLVLGSLAVLLLVRFFSEVIHILPRAVTFIDVPIVILLMLAASARPPSAGLLRRFPPFFVPAIAFLAIAVIATLANLERIEPAPVLMFLYNFLSPFGVFYAVYRLWPVGGADSLWRLLIVVGLLQFAVVGAIDLPLLFSTDNPDYITGTFGENAYQLVFFLIVFATLVVATTVFQPRRLPKPAAAALLAGAATVIFLAQYRALLLTTLLAIVVAAAFLVWARPASGIVVGTLVLIAFLGALTYVSERFPVTKLQETTTAIQEDPGFFVRARFDVLDDVLQLYSQEPRYLLTGTGPATYSSRAWRTFADTAETRTAVAAPFVRDLSELSGGPYETDVANAYTIPRMRSAPVVLGSRALTWPLSSYTSLLAEVGLLGFIVLIGTYVAALLYACSLTMRAIRQRLPDDPLPAIGLAAVIAFTVLLQLAALENWLEVTRVTFLSWLLLAVAAKESNARAEAQPL